MGGNVVSGRTFVLIPGAGGDAWYWHLLVPELEHRGHRAVAVDLPSDDAGAGLPEYADAVCDAFAKASASDGADASQARVIVVAQSLGGFTAPLVCDRLPVDMVVLINAMIPAPDETAGAWWDNTSQVTARQENDVRNGRAPNAPFDIVSYFFHDVPQPITDVAVAGGRGQEDKPFSQAGLHGTWPDVPTRVLSGRDDRFFPVDFQRRVAEERLGITPDVMPGGHLVALAYPALLASRLDGYAASLV